MKKTQILMFCCMMAINQSYSMNISDSFIDSHERRNAKISNSSVITSVPRLSEDQSDSFESVYQSQVSEHDENNNLGNASDPEVENNPKPSQPRLLVRPRRNSNLTSWPTMNAQGGEITQTQVTIQQSRISGYQSTDAFAFSPRIPLSSPLTTAVSASIQNFHIRGASAPEIGQLDVDTRDPTRPFVLSNVHRNDLEYAMRAQKVARILAIDGGGIRGLIPSVWCRVLESMVRKPLQDTVHMFSGTSTGGIIASALALPEPYAADQIVDLYMSKGRNIFVKRKWFDNPFGIFKSKYRTGPAYGVFSEYFKDCKLSDVQSDLVVTHFDLSHQVSKLFRSYMARENSILYDYYMRDVVASTTAAPTYFRPFKLRTVHNTDNNIGSFSNAIDGGVYANNPSLHALKEATHLYSNADAYLLISMGTGSFKEQLNPKTLLNWAVDITGIVMQGAEDTTSAFIHEYEQFFPKPIYFVRTQVGLYKEHKDMDNLSSDNLSYLARLPEASASEIDKLRVIAPAFRIDKTPRGELIESLVNQRDEFFREN